MDLFDLQARVSLNTNDYKKGLSDAGKSFSEFGSKIKDGAAQIAKVSTAAIGAASAAVGKLVKDSVSAYADYEQLVGGVQKLFGESSDLLMAYAKDAVTTAGMSVNAYMETATGFAAALTSSVQAAGGSMDEAVEYADTAMRDMADNANTFGTDLASIQNAYQGFAKQNYTMLDNLKLGYGGTKAEMERLIEDANKLREEQGRSSDLTIESYADIITAIHEVQVATNIYRTTEKEAAKTISGSINATKAAWKNLTVEMVKDDGNISEAFEILGENAGNVIKNILPRVEQAIGGVGELIVAAAPQISKAISQLIPKLVPSILKSGASLVGALGKGLAQSLPDIVNIIPDLMDSGISIMAQINKALRDGEGMDFSFLSDIAQRIVDRIPTVFRFGQRILSAIAEDILNVDYGKLAQNMQKVFVSAINSMTDFVKSIDFYKVGENIADFMNNIDWQKVANTIFDLLAAAIKGLGDVAVSFFANADLGNLITGIGLLSGKSLLGGIGDFFGSTEGQEMANNTGMSWSTAFMSGIKAFGLGWAIGTYLRDNITIGDKTLGEWIDSALEETIPTEYDTAENTGYIVRNGQVIAVNPDSDVYKRYNPEGYAKWEKEYKGKSFEAAYEDYWGVKPPGYAEGGRVTRPTLAWVGEKEPETIIPDSKLNSIGSTTNYITINVDGYSIKNDEEFTELLSRKLSELSIRQQRAVGGAGW